MKKVQPYIEVDFYPHTVEQEKIMSIFDKYILYENSTKLMSEQFLKKENSKISKFYGRMRSESLILYKIFDNISFLKIFNNNYIIVNYKNIKYTINVPNDYPFKPPTNFMCDDIYYIDFLTQRSSKAMKSYILTNYGSYLNFYDIECIKTEKWSTTTRISTIIKTIRAYIDFDDEITAMFKICVELQYKKFCDFIDLFSYLF